MCRVYWQQQQIHPACPGTGTTAVCSCPRQVNSVRNMLPAFRQWRRQRRLLLWLLLLRRQQHNPPVDAFLRTHNEKMINELPHYLAKINVAHILWARRSQARQAASQLASWVDATCPCCCRCWLQVVCLSVASSAVKASELPSPRRIINRSYFSSLKTQISKRHR